jgi:ribonuclease HII
VLTFERQLWNEGVGRLAGVDEAGRGPLAGPVVAAAVVFDREFVERETDLSLLGLTDSKQLSESRRNSFYELLMKCPGAEAAVGIAGAGEIDSLNILRATHLAMARAVAGLKTPPEFVIVDGLPVKGLPCRSIAIVRGDSKSISIAAASVVAKVTRDSMMREMDRVYPRYGFAGHKGYGSRTHVRALIEFGPCPEHRLTFRPVREAAELHSRLRNEPPERRLM